MPFVYSTLTNPQKYVEYRKGGSKDVHEIVDHVTIKGGTGIANKNFVTPLGVVTRVTDKELEFLEANDAFQRHKKAKFMTVRAEREEAEVVAADMQIGDGSSPKVPSEYINADNGAKPAEGKDQEKSSFLSRFRA